MLTVQDLYARRRGELTRATLMSFIMSAVVLLAAVWKRTLRVCVNLSATAHHTGQSGIPLEGNVNDVDGSGVAHSYSALRDLAREGEGTQDSDDDIASLRHRTNERLREEIASQKKTITELRQLVQLLREKNGNVDGAGS